jgi:MFS family permease
MASRDPRIRLTVGLVLDMTVVAFEALAVATVAPRAAQDLGGLDLYGWTFSAFMLAGLVGTVIGGHTADRHGLAAPYTGGVVAFTAGLLVCGAAPTMPIFVIGRAVQGLGAGGVASIGFVAIGRAFSETERPRQFAILSTAWVIPGLVAPAVGGLVAEHLGWRVVFLGIAVLPGAALALVLPPLRRLDAERVERAERADTGSHLPIRAALLLAAGTAAVVEGLGISTAWIAVPLVAAGVAVALPALRRLVPPGTLRVAPGLPAAVATRAFATFAFFGTDAFFAFALAEVRHLSAVEVGLVLTPTTMTWTLGSWLQARTIDRFTRRAMATAGLALIVLGAALTGVAVLASGLPVWIGAATWALGGLGMGMSYGPTNLVVLSEAPKGAVGATTASVELTDGLGTALGTGIGGAIVAAAATSGWSRTSALGVVFAVMAVVGVAGVVGAHRFPRDPGPFPPAPPPAEGGEGVARVERGVDAAVVASGPHDDDDLS